MRSSCILMIVVIVLVGCHGNDDGGGGSSNSTTPSLEKESFALASPDKRIEGNVKQNENIEYIRVPNTRVPDYALYRKEWRRINGNVNSGISVKSKLVYEKKSETPVEIELDKLSFKEAFIIQYRAKGEGHTFWWRGNTYTTNLLHDNPSVDEE